MDGIPHTKNFQAKKSIPYAVSPHTRDVNGDDELLAYSIHYLCITQTVGLNILPHIVIV